MRTLCVLAVLVGVVAVVGRADTFRWQSDMAGIDPEGAYTVVTVEGNGDLTLDNVTTIFTLISDVSTAVTLSHFGSELTDLSALQPLQSTSLLQLFNLTSIVSLTGIEGLDMGTLDVSACPSLPSLDGFNRGLSTVSGLYLYDLPSLTSLSGLNFTSIVLGLELIDLPALTDLTRLEAVTGDVGRVEIRNIGATSLSLHVSVYELVVVNCPGLAAVVAPLLIQDSGIAIVGGHPLLGGEVAISGDEIFEVVAFDMPTLGQLGLEGVSMKSMGGLVVYNTPAADVSFVNASFPTAAMYTFALINTGVTSLDGLSGAVAAITGGIVFVNNSRLVSTAALGSAFLPYAAWSEPQALFSDTAVAYVPTANEYATRVEFSGNPLLDGPLGIEGLDGVVTRDVTVSNNANLTTISLGDATGIETTFLDVTGYVDGLLDVSRNARLRTISLPSMTNLASLRVTDNPELRNITAPVLAGVDGSASLLNNPKLNCISVADLTSTVVFGGVLYFDGDCVGGGVDACLSAATRTTWPPLGYPPASCNTTLTPVSNLATALSALVDSFTAPGVPVTICLAAGEFTGCDEHGVTLTTCGGGPVSIVGAGIDQTTINCNYTGRFGKAGADSYVRLAGLTIEKATTVNGHGSGLLSDSGHVELEHVRFANHTTNAVFVSGGSVAATNCVFASNSVTSSAAAAPYVGASLTGWYTHIEVRSSSFIDNVITGGGGALQSSYGSVAVINTTFASNTASGGVESGAGAGVCAMYASSIVAANSSFADSTANAGGAILNVASTVYTDVTLTHSTFRGNSGGDSGAVALSTANIQVDGCVFDKNSVTTSGGSIWLSSTTLVITNTQFYDCSCGYRGACMYSTDYLYFYGQYLTVLVGYAGNRGVGLFVEDGSTGYVEVYDSSFKNLTSFNQVGGVRVPGEVPIVSHRCHFQYIDTGDDGTAILSMGGPLEFINGSVSDTVCGDAGGIRSFNGGPVVVSNSVFVKFSGTRGAVCGAHVTATNCTFVENFGTRMAGALKSGYYTDVSNSYFIRSESGTNSFPNYGGAAFGTDDADAVALIANCSFEESYSQQNGGALLTYNSMTVVNSVFRASRADVFGGVAYGYVVTMRDCVIEDSQSLSDGGAVYTRESANLYNVTIRDTYSAGYGGAVAVSGANVVGLTITNSSCAGNGGALYSIPGETSHWRDVVVRDSRSDSMGGALYAEGSVNGSNVQFVDSYSRNIGGAVFVFRGSVHLEDSTIVASTAETLGGAVFLFFDGSLSLVRSHMTDFAPDGIFCLLSESLSLVDSVVEAAANITGLVSVKGTRSLRVESSVLTSPFAALSFEGVNAGTITGSFFRSSGVGYASVSCGSAPIQLSTSVFCATDAPGLACGFGCDLSGDRSCADLSLANTTDCYDECEEASFCVPALSLSTVPNGGCPSCDGVCWAGASDCDTPSTKCFDAPNSGFSCVCASGFTDLSANGTSCTDIDECALGTDDCTGPSVCVNTPGSFTCDCGPGFYPVGPTACADIDECTVTPGICSPGTCTDTSGSFTCACPVNTYTYAPLAGCRACGPGHYVEGSDCLDCPAGTYSNATNVGGCVTCPEFSTSGPGVAACDCDDGFVWTVDSGVGSSSGTGSGSSGSGSSGGSSLPACVISCELGEFVAGTSVCVACYPGTFGSSPGVCSWCPQGMTTVADGETQCVCASGFEWNAGAGPFNGSSAANWTVGCHRVCPPGYFVDVLADECVPCESGFYKGGTSDDTNCTACPLAGMVTAVGADSIDDCACNPGYAPETQNSVLRCAAVCGPGYRRPSFESECAVCGPGTYTVEVNEPNCRKCPANSVTPAAAGSVKECECQRGYYSPSGKSGVPCLPCPSGARCPGGRKAPVAKKGYVSVGGDDSGREAFVLCSPPEACSGGDKCSTYYTGERCAECTADAHRVSGYCRPCGAATTVGFVFGLLLVFVGCAVMVASNLRAQTLTHATSFVIGINALQIVAQFGRLQIAWPRLAQRFFDFVAVISLNVEVFAPECVASATNPFFARFFLMMAVPAFVAAVLAMYYGVFKAAVFYWDFRRVTEEEFVRAILQSVSQMVLVLYLPLSVAVFEYFDCVPVGSGGTTQQSEVRVVATSPEVVCGSPQWNRGLIGAVPFLLAYPLVFPILFTYGLWHYHEAMNEASFALRFGWVTNRYRRGMYLYEIAILFRKLGVAICLTFIAASPYIQAGATFIWLVFGFAVHVGLKPYGTREHNFFESACSCVVEFVVLAGIMFQDASFNDVRKNTTIVILIVALMVAVAAAAAWDVYGVVQELRVSLSDGAAVGEVKRATQREAVSDVALFGSLLDGFQERVRSGKLTWKVLVECDVELAELEVARAAGAGGPSGDGSNTTTATAADAKPTAETDKEAEASVIDRNNMVWLHPHVGGVTMSLCVDNAGEFFLRCEEKLSSRLVFVLYVMEPGRYIVSGLRTHEVHLAKNTQLAATFASVEEAETFVRHMAHQLPGFAQPIAGSVLYRARQGGVEGLNTVGDTTGGLRAYVAAFELELFYLKTAMVGAIGWAFNCPPPPRVLQPEPPTGAGVGVGTGVGAGGAGGSGGGADAGANSVAEFRLRNLVTGSGGSVGGGSVNSVGGTFNSAVFETGVFSDSYVGGGSVVAGSAVGGGSEAAPAAPGDVVVLSGPGGGALRGRTATLGSVVSSHSVRNSDGGSGVGSGVGSGADGESDSGGELRDRENTSSTLTASRGGVVGGVRLAGGPGTATDDAGSATVSVLGSGDGSRRATNTSLAGGSGGVRLTVLSRANLTYIRELGSGGFGATKLYRESFSTAAAGSGGVGGSGDSGGSGSTRPGRRVAMRVYTHRAEVEAFVDEAVLLAVVDHANVVEFAGVCPELVGLATVYCDGGDFATALAERGGQLGYAERVRILFGAAKGLHYLHSELGVAHRDFWPGAVLLGTDGSVRVGRLSRAGAPGAPKYGARPGYASPEQRSGEAGTLSCDVYAFGVSMREVLEGSAARGGGRGSGAGGGAGRGGGGLVISGLPVEDDGGDGCGDESGSGSGSAATGTSGIQTDGVSSSVGLLSGSSGGGGSGVGGGSVGGGSGDGEVAPALPPRRRNTTKDTLLAQATRARARGSSDAASGTNAGGGPAKPPRRGSGGADKHRSSTVAWRRYDPEGHLRVRTARGLLDALDRGLCASLGADRPSMTYVVGLVARAAVECGVGDEADPDTGAGDGGGGAGGGGVRGESASEWAAVAEDASNASGARSGYGYDYGVASAARVNAAKVNVSSETAATQRGGGGSSAGGGTGGRGSPGRAAGGAAGDGSDALATSFGDNTATQRVAVDYTSGARAYNNSANAAGFGGRGGGGEVAGGGEPLATMRGIETVLASGLSSYDSGVASGYGGGSGYADGSGGFGGGGHGGRTVVVAGGAGASAAADTMGLETVRGDAGASGYNSTMYASDTGDSGIPGLRSSQFETIMR